MAWSLGHPIRGKSTTHHETGARLRCATNITVRQPGAKNFATKTSNCASGHLGEIADTQWAESARRTILRRRAPMTEQPPPSPETSADTRPGEEAPGGA